MDELEHKLRSALTEMAGEVAPSHHPWAEHQRRISARKSRRPFLMAAVAAAVVALIAVPVMVLQARTDTVQPADGSPGPSASPRTSDSAPSSTDARIRPEGVYRPQAGETVITQPVTLLYEGSDVRVMAYTTQRDDKRFLCLFRASVQQQVVIEGSAGSTCTALTPPRAGKYVWASRLVNGPAGQGAQMLYVASGPTDHVLVRRADETYGMAHRIAQGTEFSLFSAYLSTSSPPLAYTARDKANVTLENG